MKYHPRFPVYVISKGRWENGLTAKFLLNDGVDFRLVIEPQEKKGYSKVFGEDRLLILPFSNLGKGSIPARNWVWEHAKSYGYSRHWILDDNIYHVQRLFRKKRINCNSGPALFATEDFIERYENIAIAGLNYSMFGNSNNMPPFYLNHRVYSCLLILNSLPYRWRGRYNEDADLCLQVLSGGWCTVLMNAFLIQKKQTMKSKGGNTSELYKGDGRLKMARSLERVWPGVVKTIRRFHRPQHYVFDSWRAFTTPLKFKSGFEVSKNTNEYGMKITKVSEIKSKSLKKLYEENISTS